MAEVSERKKREPGPDHPIEIESSTEQHSVTVAGKVIARSERALVLREADYAPVLYFPEEDVDFSALSPTDHSSYCPFKGEANYYSVPAGGARAENAVWQYRAAYPAVAAIDGHLAFYPDRVDSID